MNFFCAFKVFSLAEVPRNCCIFMFIRISSLPPPSLILEIIKHIFAPPLETMSAKTMKMNVWATGEKWRICENKNLKFARVINVTNYFIVLPLVLISMSREWNFFYEFNVSFLLRIENLHAFSSLNFHNRLNESLKWWKTQDMLVSFMKTFVTHVKEILNFTVAHYGKTQKFL